MIKVAEDGSFIFEIVIKKEKSEMVQSIIDYCLTEIQYDRVNKTMNKIVRKGFYDDKEKVVVIKDKIDPYTLHKLQKYLKEYDIEYKDIIIDYYGNYKENK